MAGVDVQQMPSCSMQMEQSKKMIRHRSHKSSHTNNNYKSNTQHDNNNNNKSQNQQHKRHTKNYDTMFVENTVALAVITRLHQWCCQLFWLTIVCVVSCCGELHKEKSKTLADVRRTIANGSQRRCKTVTDLEMQLLRHLTSPQTAILRPLRSSGPKKRQLSRPPSPQLFDICEEVEPQQQD